MIESRERGSGIMNDCLIFFDKISRSAARFFKRHDGLALLVVFGNFYQINSIQEREKLKQPGLFQNLPIPS